MMFFMMSFSIENVQFNCLPSNVYSYYPELNIFIYTEYAGCAITARIPVNFGTAHGRLRPEVGNRFRTDAHGRKGVPPFSRIFGTSKRKITPPTIFLRPKHNFFSLTVCSLEQYLQNGSENKMFLS